MANDLTFKDGRLGFDCTFLSLRLLMRSQRLQFGISQSQVPPEHKYTDGKDMPSEQESGFFVEDSKPPSGDP